MCNVFFILLIIGCFIVIFLWNLEELILICIFFEFGEKSFNFFVIWLLKWIFNVSSKLYFVIVILVVYVLCILSIFRNNELFGGYVLSFIKVEMIGIWFFFVNLKSLLDLFEWMIFFLI